MKTLRLILGDQLNHQHTWFKEPNEDVLYVMMELHQESEYVTHHIQKVIGFFLAMRTFAEELQSSGHQLVYIRIDDPRARNSFTDNLEQLMREHSANCFEYQDPDEYRLEAQFRDWSTRMADTGIRISMVDSEHFLSARDEWSEFFHGKKQRLMESFYRGMRRKHQVLMCGSEPLGGQWNFDHDNRSKYDGSVAIIPPIPFPKNITALLEAIDQVGIKTMGSVDADGFIWPTSRSEALLKLNFFCEHLLPHFGKYQDAMVRNEHFLFHSRLSFCLNVKLLHPMEVIQAAVNAHLADAESFPLAATEGFVRQILGWREYMRGLYWSEMPGYEKNNALNNQTALPAWFWTGETKMACMSQCIQQSLTSAYAHHIQRLMVIGNFCLLAGIQPHEVHQWYLGVYIDAIEWVEITNTLGMSQYADGGIVATKPYVSGGNYIQGMSNYCASCSYAVKEKTGERACPFNSLYWHFIDRHADRWAKNQRMSMMLRSWQKRSPEDREHVLKDAERILSNLESL